ncbi:helix-turn-helix domain-containing protein [Rhodococcus jostii]
MQFSDEMKQRRAMVGMSQRKLADLLEEIGVKLDPSAITRLEVGQREPKLREAIAIADILGIDLDELRHNSDAVFRTHLLSMETHMREARAATVAATVALERALEFVARNSADSLLAKNNAASVDELLQREIAWFRNEIAPGMDFVGTARTDDARLKRAVVEAVVSNLFLGADNDSPS